MLNDRSSAQPPCSHGLHPRCYHNITALIDSPSDRILVIYGPGHLGWLREDVENDASVRLRKLGDLIR